VNTYRTAAQLDAVADGLAAVGGAVARLPVPALGAHEAGLPGRVGGELHTRWAALLTARSREAADAAARVAQLAEDLRATARQYAETDEAARRRIARGPS
jgi:Excreted virulence factor EspC, type VII ESX diderm